jgi:hypothetical protein
VLKTSQVWRKKLGFSRKKSTEIERIDDNEEIYVLFGVVLQLIIRKFTKISTHHDTAQHW